MNIKQAMTTIEAFEALPIRIKRNLHIVTPDALSGAPLVKDKIYFGYKDMAKIIRAVMLFKRSHGYCSSGEYSCMRYVGMTQFSCEECLTLRREQRRRALAGESRKVKLTPYGIMRAAERKAETAERKRVGKP